MIRCYIGKVLGFGHQLIKALIEPPPEGPESEAVQPGPRVMHPASAPMFQTPRRKMETEWTPGMMRLPDIDRESLPIIWDADFLYGPRTESGEDPYVLCEINVSPVFATPDEAPEPIARLAWPVHDRQSRGSPLPRHSSDRRDQLLNLVPLVRDVA
jgi:hypothetical protein